MSERKVIQKYFPPDFDPAAIERKKSGRSDGAPKFAPVRLMAPFNMCCTRCGEYIAKGRKFNARKQVTDETYLAIKVIRFYIRCTRCSGEITFKTDPRNNDYTCERGAKRGFEPWRNKDVVGETDEQRLDRLEAAEQETPDDTGVDTMAQLEAKHDAVRAEMATADALDSIRERNARLDRAAQSESTADAPSGPSSGRKDEEEETKRAQQQEKEDGDAFKAAVSAAKDEELTNRPEDNTPESQFINSFAASKKRKSKFAIPGVRKKVVAT